MAPTAATRLPQLLAFAHPGPTPWQSGADNGSTIRTPSCPTLVPGHGVISRRSSPQKQTGSSRRKTCRATITNCSADASIVNRQLVDHAG